MKEKKLIYGCLCAMGCEALYGLSFMFSKKVTEEIGILALLGWRFFIAFVVMSLCVLIGLINIQLKDKPKKPLLLFGLLFPCLYFIAETVGIDQTTASESGIFLACIPVISLAAAAKFLKRKPTKLQITGIFITLIGVCITVASVGLSSSFSPVGYLFLTIAVISYIVYSMLVDVNKTYTGSEITYAILVVGAVFFTIAAIGQACFNGTFAELITLPMKNSGFLTAILYQGIGCSVLAFFMNNSALSLIGVSRTSSFIGVSTVVSVIAGAVFLQEKMLIGQIVGAVVIILGIYIANVIGSAKSEAEKDIK